MWIIFLVFGAIFGSAANALIDRLPKNISWVKGRSVCDNCGHELNSFDLIPLLSFAVLGGKCRYCHKKINARNFWVELTTALAFVVIGFCFANLYVQILLCLIFWATLIISVMDFETKLVADAMVVVWGGLVLGLQFAMGNLLHINNIWGLLVAAGLIGGIWAISKGRAMGSGDIGIAAVLGWWVAWPKVWVALWMAFVLGAVFGTYKLMNKKNHLKDEVAFGPWLVLGSWIGFLWGEKLLKMIVRF